MILPVFIPFLIPGIVSLAVATGSFVGVSISVYRNAKQAAKDECPRQIKSSHFIEELVVWGMTPCLMSKNGDSFDALNFESEEKILRPGGVDLCSVTNRNEEYSFARFYLFTQNSRPARQKPEFKEFWIGKNKDSRAKELIEKEQAYEGRQFVKIETFLYVDELESRMKYQEKSFWLSKKGIFITPKDANASTNSKEKTYIAEITLGKFKVNSSGELYEINRGIARIKMTREGLDIHDHSCSTGPTFINAKTAFEELLEGEERRLAHKKSKLNSPKPSTNLDGMELRKRGVERS